MGWDWGSASPTLAWTRKRSRSYYDNENKNILEAWLASQASPEEQRMMAQQIESYKQSLSDRKATRSMILAQMGLKIGKDAKGNQTLVPLTREERLKAMTEAQKSRAGAAEAYTQRANAALTGQTKLPSFLKSNIDYKKETENAMLSEMFGEGYEKSTAAQQVFGEMKKKEEDIRQQLQDQDIAVTPGMSQRIHGMLADEAAQKIGMYEYLPRQGEALMRGRGSLLNDMQQERLNRYKYRLGQIEADRAEKQSYIQAMASIFGAGGGMAAGQRKKKPEYDYSKYDSSMNNMGFTGNYENPLAWMDQTQYRP